MDPIWQNRMDALTAQLDATASQLANSPSPSNDALLALTQSLQTFGPDQFHFFMKGFTTNQLLPAMKLPAEHVLRATLDQIAFDLTLIRRIYQQRQETGGQATLTQADKLAQAGLDVAVQAGLLPQTAVLTYFNKSANIRIIPYAPLALVGLPYTATHADLDFLAIPHEVGHYVYHHAPGLAAHLHAHIPLYPEWANHWLEEIFADVYGTLVAGPVAGLSLQSLLRDNAQAQFVADDGEHPVDAVRPYIHSTVLRQLNNSKAADALDAAWEAELARRHWPTQFLPHNSHSPADLAQARTLLEQTAVSLLTYLQTNRLLSQPKPWSTDHQDLAKLQANFTTWLTQPLKVDHYLLTAVGPEIGVATNGGPAQNLRAKGSTQTWRDWFKAQARQNPTVPLPYQAWRPIFTSGHWPVKGPEGNSDGGI
ncbi:MAG: hypothetical protein IPJ90_19450 [Anaerolineaceae bacterium]|nr:hypothetical protein [Anaerolineaceae bacterium]